MTDETKKRSNEVLNDEKQLKRRKELDPELSEEGPLTQSDVVFFQKEAIFRQMKLYKKQSKLLNHSLTLFKAKYQANQKNLSVLSLWYSQIIELLSSRGILKGNSKDENLLINFDDSNIDDTLKERRTKLLEILTPLIGNSENTSPEKQELLNNIDELTFQLVSTKSENEVLSNENSLLNEQVSMLNEKILDITKGAGRIDSKSLKRVDEGFKKNAKEESNGDIKTEDENAGVSESNGNGIGNGNGNSNKVENSDDKSNTINSEEFENLTIELSQLRTENENLKKHLDEQVKANSDLRDQTQDMAYNLANPGDREVMTTPLYQKLNQSYIDLQLEFKNLKDSNIVNAKKIEEMEKEKDSFKDEIENNFNKEKENLTELLSKNESDLIRIRTIRDDLLSKIAILKSQAPNKELVGELNTLVDIQRQRIEVLEKANSNSCDEIDSDSDSSKLKELNEEQLIKKVQVLTKELKELETAFKGTHLLSIKKLNSLTEVDSKLNKLTVEKTKADQKYFAAMRVKDALTLENKTIKLQMNKSNEVINQFKELEKTFTLKLENSNLIQQDLKFQIINKEEELKQLRPQNQNLVKNIANKENEIKDLTKIKEQLREKINSSESKLRELEINFSKTNSKLKTVESLLIKYQKNDKSAIMQEDQEQVNGLRSMVKCSVCSKNWKNTVIKNCGHVFCNECAQERLAARLRRCPSCNKQFSSNDLLSIHL